MKSLFFIGVVGVIIGFSAASSALAQNRARVAKVKPQNSKNCQNKVKTGKCRDTAKDPFRKSQRSTKSKQAKKVKEELNVQIIQSSENCILLQFSHKLNNREREYYLESTPGQDVIAGNSSAIRALSNLPLSELKANWISLETDLVEIHFPITVARRDKVSAINRIIKALHTTKARHMSLDVDGYDRITSRAVLVVRSYTQ